MENLKLILISITIPILVFTYIMVLIIAINGAADLKYLFADMVGNLKVIGIASVFIYIVLLWVTK